MVSDGDKREECPTSPGQGREPVVGASPMARSMRVDSRTPFGDGFSMPAEWEAHDACYMAWPCRPERWQGFYAEAKAFYAAVARAVGQFEPVVMLASPHLVREARDSLGPEIEVIAMEMD